MIETGDFHVSTVGDNLPNENEIREKYGSKSFLFTGSSRTLRQGSGFGALEEFAASPEEIALSKKYGEEASDLMTALHEIIGHGSGKLNPKLQGGSEAAPEGILLHAGRGARRPDGAMEYLRSQAAGTGPGFQSRRHEGDVLRRGADGAHPVDAHSARRHD